MSRTDHRTRAERARDRARPSGARFVPVECDSCGRLGVKVPSGTSLVVLCEDCAAHAACESGDENRYS